MAEVQAEVLLLAITPDAEALIEEAGRTCYLSFEKIGTNQNFIQNSIRRGHLSIIEHACATFRIKGGSRSFTHQLVRHRLASFSQQSQRYVDEGAFSFMVPDSVKDNDEAHALYTECIENIRHSYRKLRELGVRKEDARFLLPNALESEIVFTANFRELRHLFDLRLEKHAQWEIRKIALMMLRLMQEQAPAVFGDYVIDEENQTASSTYK